MEKKNIIMYVKNKDELLYKILLNKEEKTAKVEVLSGDTLYLDSTYNYNDVMVFLEGRTPTKRKTYTIPNTGKFKDLDKKDIFERLKVNNGKKFGDNLEVLMCN